MKYFSEYVEEAQSKLFDTLGCFFTFSHSGFKEKAKKDIVYVSLGFGLYCPKDNINKFKKRYDEIIEEGVIADVEDNGAEAIIRREYFNYESHITMDTSEAKDALASHIEVYPDKFTDEFIEDVFSECWKEAVEGDMF